MSVNKVNSDGSLSRVAGGTLYADMAIGTIVPFGGSKEPSGFLFCQGQAVSRTTYEELFKVIGTAYGSGDGSTTFNLPDLREATTKGVGLSGKSSNHYDSDGVALGEFVEDRIKEHTHQVYVVNGTGSGSSVAQGTAGSTPRSYITPTGEATNEVKAVGVNYIIKAVQSAIPIDIANAVDDKLSALESNVTELQAVVPELQEDVNNRLHGGYQTQYEQGFHNILIERDSQIGLSGTYTLAEYAQAVVNKYGSGNFLISHVWSVSNFAQLSELDEARLAGATIIGTFQTLDTTWRKCRLLIQMENGDMYSVIVTCADTAVPRTTIKKLTTD